MNSNVLSWKSAVQRGHEPGKYGYGMEAVPVGTYEARLDFKLWASKILGIGCYFTQVDSGKHFQITVYCQTKTGHYQLNDGTVDFAVCEINRVYLVTIIILPMGKPILQKAILI